MLVLFLCGLSAVAGIMLLAGCGGANTPPAASAVGPATAFVGHPAELDGVTSSDLEQDPLTYTWSLDARPEGSAAALSGADLPKASLTGDVRGVYAVSLVVSDGQSYSEASRQTVTVQPWFSDVTQEAGVTGWGMTEKTIMMSTDPLKGAAWGDYDGDGDQDLYVARALVLDKFGLPNREDHLYRNNGDGTFTDVIVEATSDSFGLKEKQGDATRSVVWGDYDGDGDLDLYATNSGARVTDPPFVEANVLYRNNGDGTFSSGAVEAGVADERFAMGAAWGDYDNDGDLDLAIANHARIEQLEEKLGPRPESPYAQYKTNWFNEAGALYRNDGDGAFTDVAPSLGILQDPTTLKEEWDIATVKCGSPWQPFWFDYDNDGDQDLFFTCETSHVEYPSGAILDFPGTNLLYRNNGDGTFADVTRETGLWESTGHGVDAGDYDNDGDLDLIVTDAGTNHLWRNDEGEGMVGGFTEVTSAAGVAGRGGVGWGAAFFDFDNDGDLDICVAGGDWTTWGNPEERKAYNVNLLYENKGDGTFEEVSEASGLDLTVARGIWQPAMNRGLALADYDNDGDIDVFFTSSDDWNYLYRNDIANDLGNNWLKVRLEGTASNTYGIGATVKVTSGDLMRMEQLYGGSGFLSMDAPELHFGLADRSVVETIRVSWPSGIVQIVRDVKANQTITITEP